MTQERLKEIIEYFPESGIFVWRSDRGRARGGRVAGTLSREGYIVIWADGKAYKAHRLAFLYMTGECPKQETDHINGIRTDNRWQNLREATKHQNAINKKTGRGYYQMPGSEKFMARVKVHGKIIYLGTHVTEALAHEAYIEGCKKYFNSDFMNRKLSTEAS